MRQGREKANKGGYMVGIERFKPTGKVREGYPQEARKVKCLSSTAL